jgi:glycosyltransferase involved in cell wall biosynthesis
MTATPEAPRKPRALIQYNCVPHYRARIFELLTQCDTVEFEIIADTLSDTPYLKTWTGEEARTMRIRHASMRMLRLWRVPDMYWQPHAVASMMHERPDAVIALGTPYSITAWALLIMGRVLHIPVLLWGHGLLERESGPKWWLRRALYRLAAGQLLYGDRARQLLADRGFDPRALYVVYNSLDYDTQAAIARALTQEMIDDFRRGLGVRAGEGLTVFTGRLQPAKQLDLLIQALAELARRGSRVHVALVGDGSERHALAQLAERLHIADLVHFLGESYDEAYLGLVVGSSDLAVIPSAAGLSVMHAMVFGTPVLLHDRLQQHGPEWEAVIEGRTGFFYRYGDRGDLADKIDHAVLRHPARSAMAEACKTVIKEKYNPHRQVETFVRAVLENAGGNT